MVFVAQVAYSAVSVTEQHISAEVKPEVICLKFEILSRTDKLSMENV